MKVAFLCCILLLAGSASCSPVEANSISLPDIDIPDWILDVISKLPESVQEIIDKVTDLIASVPDTFEDITELIDHIIEQIPKVVEYIRDRIPEVIDAIPDIIDKLPELIEKIIEGIAEVRPIILERLEELIEYILEKVEELRPVILERLAKVIEFLVEKIKELRPVILEKLPEILEHLPALVDRIKAVLQRVVEKIPEIYPIILETLPKILEAIPEIFESVKEIYDLIKDKLEEYDLPDWFPNLPELEAPEWWPIELPEFPDLNIPVHGTPTTINEHPSIVQVEVGTGPIWAQGCIGVIVTNLHIVSVARCYSGERYNNRFRRIRAGSSTRYTDGTIVNVDNVVTHYDFNGDRFDNDIAIVRVASPLIFGSTIQQSPIVPQGFNLPAGLTALTASWGATAEGKQINDYGLYMVDLSVVSNDECRNRWSKIPVFAITDNMICAGRPETGGRNGDIRDLGAPLFYQGILTGVQSLSAPTTNQYFPVVYTKISSYTNWIQDNAV